MIFPTPAERVADADPNGCLRCCFAAILEVPLADVPHFVLDWSDERDQKLSQVWVARLFEWLRGFGMTALTVQIPEDADADLLRQFDGLLHVRCGATPQGVAHAVVYRGDEMVYDCNGRDSGDFWPTMHAGYLGVILVPLAPAQWRQDVYSDAEMAEDAATVNASLAAIASGAERLITGDELKVRLDQLTGNTAAPNDVVDCAAERLV